MKFSQTLLLSAFVAVVAGSALTARAQTAITPTTNWQSAITVGATLARGNTDTTLFSAAIDSAKKWAHSDLILHADDIYGESKVPGQPNTETADAEHAFSQYDQNFTDRFYGFGRLEGLHDGIADIQYRMTLAPGAGYYFIKNKKADLSLEGGPGFIAEKLDDHTSSYVTLRAAERGHWQLSDHSKVWESIEYLPQVDHFDNYIVNSEIGLEAGLNKKNNLAVRLVLDDSYDNIPAPNRLKNDLKLIAGITYKF
jgi:putative salt-induced outer membrane protein YdiY